MLWRDLHLQAERRVDALLVEGHRADAAARAPQDVHASLGRGGDLDVHVSSQQHEEAGR